MRCLATAIFFLLLPAVLVGAPAGAEEDLSHVFPKVAEKLEQKSNIQRYRAFKEIYDPKGATRFPAPTLVDRLKLYEKSLQEAMKRSDNELGRILGRWAQIQRDPSAGYGGLWQGVSWPFFSFAKTLGVYAASSLSRGAAPSVEPELFTPDPAVQKHLLHFLRTNTTPDGMPLSYSAPDSYWASYKSLMTPVDAALERLLTKHGLSIYDGALWQIALTAGLDDPGDAARVSGQTERLLSGSSGELRNIRASGEEYLYGDKRLQMEASNAYFFRIIADRYMQSDPLSGDQPITGFPNFETPHHEDWKPITGEQAWGAIIGPLQTAYLTHGGHVPADCKEIHLALSILPAVEAMQSQIGALYHVPAGTRGKYPNEISVENNFSMYGALKILRQVIADSHPAEAARVETVLGRMEQFFRQHAFDPAAGLFVQGGFLDQEGFHPSQIFAVDCQTWGVLALGPQWIDEVFGEGTAFRIWENARYRAGYIDPDGQLRGVGFSDGHGIYSVEWTCGALLAIRKLRDYYGTAYSERSRYLDNDIALMRQGIEKFRLSVGPGSEAYLYSNKRYFIQFGWWANPIPSMAATAWVLLVDWGFDPFILGGGAGNPDAHAMRPSA